MEVINTQQTIIIILGVIAVAAVIKDYTDILNIIVAGLIGALSIKRATEQAEPEPEQEDTTDGGNNGKHTD